ncbi:hypothetical protein WAI453_002391 [Rhynchosporium graminicola]
MSSEEISRGDPGQINTYILTGKPRRSLHAVLWPNSGVQNGRKLQVDIREASEMNIRQEPNPSESVGTLKPILASGWQRRGRSGC